MNSRSTKIRRRLGALGLGSVTLTLMLAVVPESTEAALPANRTYFVIMQGLEERYSWQAGCLDFSRREVCTSDGDCGSWNQTEAGPDGEISFEMEVGDDEDPAQIEGRIRFETRGKREAIGGTMRVRVGADSFTVALAGRSTSPGRCETELRFWESASR